MKRSVICVLIALMLALGAVVVACGGDNGGSIAYIPVYPGATWVTGNELSGSEAAIPAIGSSANAATYAKVQLAVYETSDDPQMVLDWYKVQMKDWKEEPMPGGSEAGAGPTAAWTKDDGKEAAWISVGEDSGTTTLGIFFGTQ